MKVFVTVGTQLPFDRLIRTVDHWAGRNPFVQVFAQIGPASQSPRHVEFAHFIDDGECRQRVEEANVIVAHAGMGSILRALELGKPIIVMPRRADLAEHRNDHQVATARQLQRQGRVDVAHETAELLERLDHLGEIVQTDRIAPHASPRLLTAIRSFVTSGARPELLSESELAAFPQAD